MPPAFRHICNWIFDLDNTLYPKSANLFELIDERMGRFIADLLKLDVVSARALQKEYFVNHGTTLAGLMTQHGVEPRTFLDYVHDIPMDRLAPDPELARAISALPGRKIVFTNGDAAYARRVLTARGLGDVFEVVFDIHASAYRPKPDRHGYDRLCEELAVNPREAAMVEDMARNLRPAKQLGMATIWVNNGSEYGAAEACASFIDAEIGDVGDWLASFMGETAQ